MRLAAPAIRPKRRSQWELLLLHHTPHGRSLQHPLLECGVMLELAHREFAPDSPRVEDEAVWVENRVAVHEPVLLRQHAVNLFKIAVKGFTASILERGKSRRIGGVAFRPADMGVR